MLTAYDFTMAKLSILLVLMLSLLEIQLHVMAGHETTLPITGPNDLSCLLCCSSYRRSLVVVDLPF
jgi:ketopantoate hydroxymethyltransferase